ncbi:hypothetical protein D3C76_1701500 [compost metagenome]
MVTTRVLNTPGAELFGAVIIGGVVVRQGDLLFGDANGLLNLDPADPALPALVERALNDEAREVEWRKRLAAGASLADLNGSAIYRETGAAQAG